MRRLIIMFAEGLKSYSTSFDQNVKSKWFVPFWLFIVPALISIVTYIYDLVINCYISDCLLVTSIISSIVFAMYFVVPEQMQGIIRREKTSQKTHRDENVKALKVLAQLTMRRMSFFLLVSFLMITELLILQYLPCGGQRVLSALIFGNTFVYIWSFLSLLVSAHLVNLTMTYD